MAAEKEWSENPEDDPVELQKKQLELGKKFLEKIEKQEAEDNARKEREKAYAQAPIAAHAYTPPTLEDVSAVLKKAWDEVERIMPTAGDRAKTHAFQSLIQAAAPRPGPFFG